MFLPFGVLLGMIIQSGAKPERILLKTAVLAVFFSLIIESLQYFLPARHPAASDLPYEHASAPFSEPGSCLAALRSSHSNSARHHEQGLRHYRGDFGDRTSWPHLALPRRMRTSCSVGRNKKRGAKTFDP